MRWMLVGLMALLITSDFTGANPGLGPGLSAKNAVLYLVDPAASYVTGQSLVIDGGRYMS